jgi:hypothetical protein
VYGKGVTYIWPRDEIDITSWLIMYYERVTFALENRCLPGLG